MCDLIGKSAPEFKATAVMPDNTLNPAFTLSSLKGKYVVLFFYPLDFTFVCPTEILAFNRRYAEFKELGAEVVGVSVDSQFSHVAWKHTPVEKGGIGNVQFPLVADLTKQISKDYGVLLEGAGIAYRGTFLIDRQGVVKHLVINDLGLGRSIDEELRVLHALQHLEKHGEVCPADWHEGEDAMKPTADGVARYLSKHGK